MTFSDDELTTKNNEFLNLRNGGDSKIVINSYNKNNNIPNSIMLLIYIYFYLFIKNYIF